MKKKLSILIVDDDKRMVKTLIDILAIKGHKAEGAASGEEALEKISDNYFDCVLTDIKMPGMNGVELLKNIKALKPDIPVVLMTAYSSDALVDEGMKGGAITTLAKPLDLNLVLNFFASLDKDQSIVIVDDDPQFCKTLGDILRMRNFSVTELTDPAELIEKLTSEEQIVLLDLKLGNVSGVDILKKLRERYHYLPVIMITGYGKEMSQAVDTALSIGAYTCLYKPLEVEQLFHILTRLHHRELGRTLKKNPEANYRSAL